MMAHAQEPDFVFPRNGRVHSNRWGRQFSRLLAAEVCASLTATYADDTAILASHHDPIATTEQLQHHLSRLEQWLKRWRIRANETKSKHVTFTLRREDCPVVYIYGKHIPQNTTVKYLGIYLDGRLTWKTHIFTKRKKTGVIVSTHVVDPG